MRTRRTAILFLIVPVCLALAACRHARVNDVDLSMARIEQTDAPLIDGKDTDRAWGKAAVIPFEKTGEARFVWSERKLYGFISKYEHQRFGFYADEQICVAIRVGHRMATLFFEEALPRSVAPAILRLREARATDWSSASSAVTTIPEQWVEAASLGGMAQQGWGWSAEFSLDWSPLAASPPTGEETTISVYRLVVSAPVTHVLRMGPAARKLESQQPARADAAKPASAQP
jgi:hypothetical protein